MDRHEAIRAIVRVADEKGNGLIQYAASYALAAERMHLTGEAWRVQCLYILGNLSGWRGEEAKAVKAWLKEQSKGGK